MDRLPINGCNDISEIIWIVNAKVEGESRRFTVNAVSEQDACLQVEDKYADVEVVSAHPKPYHTPRCPICAGLNCKNPHDGRY